MWKRRKVLLQFMRRPARGNEMEFVEIESPVRGPGHRQMPGVNWVERASKERDAARMMFRGGALRLRGRQCVSQELIKCIFSQIVVPRGGWFRRVFM
jgi:hypothetical protein